MFKKEIIESEIPGLVGDSNRYSSEYGAISLLHPCRATMDMFEIYCLEGDLFCEVERYGSLNSAESRIKELLIKEEPMNKGSYFKLHQDWYEDGSDGVTLEQWLLKFQYKNLYFVIYLRWRGNPWQATIIETESDFDIHGEKGHWTELEVGYVVREEAEDFKARALKTAIQAAVELEKHYQEKK